uniref:Uncharacterized protein n=1 Tax=Solanum lycopersicum TaxID=4081 RepID=K4B4R0_SOLLC
MDKVPVSWVAHLSLHLLCYRGFWGDQVIALQDPRARVAPLGCHASGFGIQGGAQKESRLRLCKPLWRLGCSASSSRIMVYAQVDAPQAQGAWVVHSKLYDSRSGCLGGVQKGVVTQVLGDCVVLKALRLIIKEPRWPAQRVSPHVPRAYDALKMIREHGRIAHASRLKPREPWWFAHGVVTQAPLHLLAHIGSRSSSSLCLIQALRETLLNLR